MFFFSVQKFRCKPKSLQKKRPFFAGVTVFFIDPPELDMDFTGAADFVDLPVIRSVVRCLYGGSKAQGVLKCFFFLTVPGKASCC